MRNLSVYQKEFLLKYFFKNEEYVGWRGIAESLLESGECVVAGNKCIWVRGVGNFIKTSEAEGFFGCLQYSFDLELFLSSEWFKQQIEEYTRELYKKRNELSIECKDMVDLAPHLRNICIIKN